MTGALGLRTLSAASDTTWEPIPRQRLHPVDLYHMIDRVRDGWEDEEWIVAKRLQRLKWHLEELPDPYRMEALQQFETVTRARIVRDTPWLAALTSLRHSVWQWGHWRETRRAST